MAATTGVYTKMYLVSPAMYNQVRNNLKDVLQRRALEETNPGTFTQAELSGIDDTNDDEDSQGEGDTTLRAPNSPTQSITSESSVYFDTNEPTSNLDDSTIEDGPETDPSLRPAKIKRKRDEVQSPPSKAVAGAIPKKSMKFIPQQHSTPLELTVPSQYRCDICSAVFINYPALTNHKITQHNFNQSTILRTTSASTPSQSRRLTYDCLICNVQFESAAAVKQHIEEFHKASAAAMATQQSVSAISQPQSTIAFTPTHVPRPTTPVTSSRQSPSTSARDLHPIVNIRSPRVSTVSSSSSSSAASLRDRSPIVRNSPPTQTSTPSRSVQSIPIRAVPSPSQLAAASRRLDFDATAQSQPSTSQQAIAAANLQPVQPEVAEIKVPRLPLQTCQETKKTRSPVQTRTMTGAKEKPELKGFKVQCEFCGALYASKSGLNKHIKQKHTSEMSGAGIKRKWKKF